MESLEERMAIKAALFNKATLNSYQVAAALEDIETLNFGNNGFTRSFINYELTYRYGAAVILLDDEKVVGYTAAIEASETYCGMDAHYYGRDHEAVAYNTNSSIHPDYQHKGYIWQMMEILEEALREKGFRFLDLDARSETGFAAKVVSHYSDRVLFAKEPVSTMWGQQRYIRIHL